MAIASKSGVYDLSVMGNVVTGQVQFTLTGTAWDEKTNGNRYYLDCGGVDGLALDELCKLKITPSSPPGIVIQENNYPNQSAPLVGWILDTVNNVWYKVISVVNDNLIEVEWIYGTTPGSGSYIGVYTRGTNVKKARVIPASGQTMKVIGYAYGQGVGIALTLTSSNPTDVEMNLEASPYLFTGSGSVIMKEDFSGERLI